MAKSKGKSILAYMRRFGLLQMRRRCSADVDDAVGKDPKSPGDRPTEKFCVCVCAGWAKKVRPRTRGHSSVRS